MHIFDGSCTFLREAIHFFLCGDAQFLMREWEGDNFTENFEEQQNGQFCSGGRNFTGV